MWSLDLSSRINIRGYCPVSVVRHLELQNIAGMHSNQRQRRIHTCYVISNRARLSNALKCIVGNVLLNFRYNTGHEGNNRRRRRLRAANASFPMT